MKKSYIKTITIFLSLAISEMASITANAQTWYGKKYYMVRDTEDLESDKELDEMEFNYQIIMDWLTYKDLCCFYIHTGIETMGDVWFPIALYTSVDRAIYQVDAVEYKEFYLSIVNARIKNAYHLIDGRPSLINDINLLEEIDKDNLAFSLVQEDSNGNEQIVGYLNGKDVIAMAAPSMNSYEKEKQYQLNNRN